MQIKITVCSVTAIHPSTNRGVLNKPRSRNQIVICYKQLSDRNPSELRPFLCFVPAFVSPFCRHTVRLSLLEALYCWILMIFVCLVVGVFLGASENCQINYFLCSSRGANWFCNKCVIISSIDRLVKQSLQRLVSWFGWAEVDMYHKRKLCVYWFLGASPHRYTLDSLPCQKYCISRLIVFLRKVGHQQWQSHCS